MTVSGPLCIMIPERKELVDYAAQLTARPADRVRRDYETKADDAYAVYQAGDKGTKSFSTNTRLYVRNPTPLSAAVSPSGYRSKARLRLPSNRRNR